MKFAAKCVGTVFSGVVLAFTILQAGTAGAATKTQEVVTTNSDVAVVSIPLQGDIPVVNTGGASSFFTVGPNGVYFALMGGIIVRIERDGSLRALHTFGPVTYDPTTGLAINSDGVGVTRLFMGNDGNLYGGTWGGGPLGFGTLFRLTADGEFTTLYYFDHRSEIQQNSTNNISGLIGPVMGADGALYGLSYANDSAPELFRMSLSGSYTVLCSQALPYPSRFWSDNSVMLAAGKDGNFYGHGITESQGSEIFRITPSCNITPIASSLPSITSLIAGDDGNIYFATLDDTAAYNSGGSIRKITPSGNMTVLHSFNLIERTTYIFGQWDCNIFEGICTWMPGHWVKNGIADADGNGPFRLFRSQDGSVYGVAMGGLDQAGTIFRIAADGNFATLFAFPSGTYTSAIDLAEDIDGNIVSLSSYSAKIFKLLSGAPLTTTVSFNPSTVRIGQATVFSWSSTSAQSCELLGEIPSLTGDTSTSGTHTVRLYSKQERNPAMFAAGVRCTAADGSVSTAAVSVTIR